MRVPPGNIKKPRPVRLGQARSFWSCYALPKPIPVTLSCRASALSGRCGRPAPQALAKRRFLSPSGSRREPPVSAIARRSVSPGMEHARLLYAVVAFTLTIFPKTWSCTLHRSGSVPHGQGPCRFTRDRGSPFASSALRGLPWWRLASPGMELVRPLASTSSSDCIARCQNQAFVPNCLQRSLSAAWAVPLRAFLCDRISPFAFKAPAFTGFRLLKGRLASPGMGDGIRRGCSSCSGSPSFEVPLSLEVILPALL